MARTTLEIALAAYQASVARLKPSGLPAVVANSTDIATIAIDLEHALAPAIAYAQAVIAAANEVAPEGVSDETGTLFDAVAEVTGALNQASNAISTDETERSAARRFRRSVEAA
jgi:hypothetical protein